VIDNPAANPLFLLVSGYVGAALVALLVLALVREWRRRQHPELRSLLASVTTAVLLVAWLLLSLFAGGLALMALVTVLCFLCVREYVRITKPYRALVVLLYAAIGCAIAAAAAGEVIWLLTVPLAVFLAGNAVFVLSDITEGSQRQLGELLVGSYLVLPLTSWIYVRGWVDWGLQFLLLVLPCTWLSDVCGYTAGSILRGPRLAPRVSPSKTWSGACASVMGAGLGAAVIGTVIPHRSGYLTLALVGAGVGVCAIFGDLVESLVKRAHNIKDSGTLLPGFGGMLDRFDSMLFVVPVMLPVVAVLHIFAP
jgi:phosphatidate cytidylyltransferase